MDNKRNNIARRKTLTANKPENVRQTDIIILVEKAIEGNVEAFGELYGIFLDRIYRYVFYQVRDRMTAEDITEEVFIKAWNAISSCKGKEKTFSAWLYRIAHNRVIDIFRSREKEQLIEMDPVAEAGSTELEVETEIDHRELLDSIAELPPNQKQVIILKYIEGLDNREIERIMGKKQGAIRILQMRALARLRERLNGGAEEK
ncbi:MAG TPA: sigma-70 family RNA polymerase sigma factor [Dehalococcoidia bacterium]|nr:sigma-70 family RNA polymerase sigma factor [Dehalococcoidia bacterium]